MSRLRPLVLCVLGFAAGLAAACMPADLADLEPFPCSDGGACPDGFWCTVDGCRAECEFFGNGVCDEGTACEAGTDWVDCGSGSNACDLAFNGVCDEPQFCAPPTDHSDCRGGCSGTGDVCMVNGDCCGFLGGEALCVSFLSGETLCSAVCTINTDCVSGCCVGLEGGGGACGPAGTCP